MVSPEARQSPAFKRGQAPHPGRAQKGGEQGCEVSPNGRKWCFWTGSQMHEDRLLGLSTAGLGDWTRRPTEAGVKEGLGN